VWGVAGKREVGFGSFQPGVSVGLAGVC
jgi:hypothetical protein